MEACPVKEDQIDEWPKYEYRSFHCFTGIYKIDRIVL